MMNIYFFDVMGKCTIKGISNLATHFSVRKYSNVTHMQAPLRLSTVVVWTNSTGGTCGGIVSYDSSNLTMMNSDHSWGLIIATLAEIWSDTKAPVRIHLTNQYDVLAPYVHFQDKNLIMEQLSYPSNSQREVVFK